MVLGTNFRWDERNYDGIFRLYIAITNLLASFIRFEMNMAPHLKGTETPLQNWRQYSHQAKTNTGGIPCASTCTYGPLFR